VGRETSQQQPCPSVRCPPLVVELHSGHGLVSISPNTRSLLEGKITLLFVLCLRTVKAWQHRRPAHSPEVWTHLQTTHSDCGVWPLPWNPYRIERRVGMDARHLRWMKKVCCRDGNPVESFRAALGGSTDAISWHEPSSRDCDKLRLLATHPAPKCDHLARSEWRAAHCKTPTFATLVSICHIQRLGDISSS